MGHIPVCRPRNVKELRLKTVHSNHPFKAIQSSNCFASAENPQRSRQELRTHDLDLDHPLVDSHTLVSFSKESLPAAKCALHLQTRSPKSPQDTPAYAKHNVDYLASSQPRSESIHASTVLRPTSTECSQGVICSRRGNAHLSEAFSRSNVTSQEDKSQAVVIPNTNP